MGSQLDLLRTSPEDENCEFVKKSEFAKTMGVSNARVSQWVRAGMPVSSGGYVPIEQGREWVESHINKVSSKQAGESLTEARTRRELALASMAELDLQKRRSELVEVSEVNEVLGKLITGARDRLLMLEHKLTVKCRLSDEQRTTFHDLLFDCLRELSEAKF